MKWAAFWSGFWDGWCYAALTVWLIAWLAVLPTIGLLWTIGWI